MAEPICRMQGPSAAPGARTSFVGFQRPGATLLSHSSQQSLPRRGLAVNTVCFVACVAPLKTTGYSAAARDTFVDWFRRNQKAIDRTAVVTDNMLWHMVVRAMGLASGQAMKPFDDVDAAEAWLRS